MNGATGNRPITEGKKIKKEFAYRAKLLLSLGEPYRGCERLDFPGVAEFDGPATELIIKLAVLT